MTRAMAEKLYNVSNIRVKGERLYYFMDMVIKTQQVKNDPLWNSNYGFFS
jgi:hypothetical protein